MKSYNRVQYNHGITNSTAAAATLKTLRPGRPIHVTGIGAICEVAYVVGDTNQTSLTIGVSAVGSTTDVVQETLDMTAAVSATYHVFKDMENLGTDFVARPGQTVRFKTNDSNSGGSAAGTLDYYFVYREEGWSRSGTYDNAYT